MNFATALFAPLAFLLPVSGLVEARQDSVSQPEPVVAQDVLPEAGPAPIHHALPATPEFLTVDPSQGWVFRLVAENFRGGEAHQVRIEQRMTIRITPHPSPLRPDMYMGLPDHEPGPRFVERKIGKCLPVSGISGVQTDGTNRLILFMRDRRIVSAQLERACRARDFYSGFYLARTPDGQLCVDRDTLLSRSGANCKLARIRQLVEINE